MSDSGEHEGAAGRRLLLVRLGVGLVQGLVLFGLSEAAEQKVWPATDRALFIALVVTFVAWVSAEPVWLAAGHRRPAIATITSCDGTGARRACHAAVTTSGGQLVAQHVLVAGAQPEQQRVDTTLTASMVTDRGRIAYVGDERGLLVRIGMAGGLLLICGVLLGLASGVHRLPTRSGQLGAFGVSLAAPLLVQLGMLAGTW